jgi:hypothetical protein
LSVTLTAISDSGVWRVKLTWPGRGRVPRLFGKFDSRAEAEKWIEEHHWLAAQSQMPDEPPPTDETP